MIQIPLFYDPKGKMGDIRGIYYTCLFQLNGLAADIIKQAKAFTEQDGHEVYLEFINRLGADELLSSMCATAYHDILVACGCFGLSQGALRTVSDEGKSRLSLGQ